MVSFMKSLGVSASGMQAQSERLRVVSENVANADTPGYRRKLIGFDSVYNRDIGASVVKTESFGLDQTALGRVYDPTHPMADPTGHVDMSNVDLLTEIADAREARRSYEANLNGFDQARRMYDSVLGLLQR